MISFFLIFLFICSTIEYRYHCDFDSGQKCIVGLQSASFLLLNESSDEPQQPPSDVTAIQTSNDQGECFFPFQLASFQMYFCQKTHTDLPATCPTGNATGPRINCSEGEYGYDKYEGGQTGSRSYEIDSISNIPLGDYCLRFYSYLSNEMSDAMIQIRLEYPQFNETLTILTNSSYVPNRWNQIRHEFQLTNSLSKIFFVFQRRISNSNSFYFGIDDITIIDQRCEPLPITTTTTDRTSTNAMISSSDGTTRICSTTTSRTTTNVSISSSLINPTTTLSSSSINCFFSLKKLIVAMIILFSILFRH